MPLANAVEAVCNADLDVLASLFDKSLVRTRESGRFFRVSPAAMSSRSHFSYSPRRRDCPIPTRNLSLRHGPSMHRVIAARLRPR